MSASLREPLGLKIYRALSRSSEPITQFILERRLKAGKEDPVRIEERRGKPTEPRPDGFLYWIHGASVGESLSVIPLVERLRTLRPDVSFMVTTGTVTSARLMKERLPEGAFHQFIPLDHPNYVRAFIEHWRPDAAIFVESEFWPNLILQARAETSFMALVNARISPRSFEDWRRQPNAIKYILSSFDIIIAQDYPNAERLTTLSGGPVEMLGNLKNAAPPLPATPTDLAALLEQIGDRSRWLAASTHPGEEEIVIAAHKLLKEKFPGLLAVIAPRHPERGEEIETLVKESGLKGVRRSKGGVVRDNTDIYIADTLGELGLFYRLSDIAFVGGSITPKGGHNPLEPARLGAAILHGPHTFNFVETYQDMRQAGGAALVRNDRELATAVRRLLSDEKTRATMTDAARNGAQSNAEKVLVSVCAALLDKIPPKAQQA